MNPQFSPFEVYVPFLQSDKRYVRLQGGYGSGKSYHAAMKLVITALTEPGHRIYAFRKVARTLRDSVFTTIKEVIANTPGLEDAFKVNNSEYRFTCTRTGSEINCMGLDDPEKLKSFNASLIWLEEPVPEMTLADFTQLQKRLRMPGVLNQMILTYNPKSKKSFVYKEFEEGSRYSDQEFKLITTAKDNPFMPTDYIRSLEGETDKVEYQVGTLGQWAEDTELLIFPEFEIIDELPEGKESYPIGIDFGINDPMTVIRTCYDRENIYIDQLLYQSGITSPELVRMLPSLGVLKSDIIRIDSAAKDLVEQVKDADYHRAKGAKKGPGSVLNGISKMKDKKLHITRKSLETISEFEFYRWKTDREGVKQDIPVDKDNHGIDAARYSLSEFIEKRSAKFEAPRLVKRKTSIGRSRMGYATQRKRK
ncbi:MAG: PBSX family phage terminase large subunit [Bacteroidota bacterium]